MSETTRYARDKALRQDIEQLDALVSRVTDAIECRPRLRAAELLWEPLQELGWALNELGHTRAERLASERAINTIPVWPDVRRPEHSEPSP